MTQDRSTIQVSSSLQRPCGMHNKHHEQTYIRVQEYYLTLFGYDQ